MTDLTSIQKAPEGWAIFDTSYGPGINEDDKVVLEALLTNLAGSRAKLQIKDFYIPDAPMADAVSLGTLVRLYPTACFERSKWLVRHEAIHVLRTLQLFTFSEWAFLSSKAQGLGWVAKFSICQRYKTSDSNIRVEEAIAEAFASWCEQNPYQASEKQGFLGQGKNFLRNCVNFCSGRGFRSVDGIFHAIASGAVARRQSHQKRGPTSSTLASYIIDNGPYLFEPQGI